MANLYIFDSSALKGMPLIVILIEQLRAEGNLVAVIMESNADALESTKIMNRILAEFHPDYTLVLGGDYQSLSFAITEMAQRAAIEHGDISEAYFITGDVAQLAMSYDGFHSLSIEEFLVIYNLI
ncbi:hypothetical protein LCGC14_0508750 [marine sediment metagenome]|uniref:Uncharacterized protein n=1 Tax=marine sediment metagenome TaxID=412755 RepID=A0A0F9UNH7_9ZZZZ